MKRVIENISQGLNTENVEARRLFHGRGQCYDGLSYINVDWFTPVLLITLYQQPDEQEWEGFSEQLKGEFFGRIDCAIVQRRYLRGAPIETLWGVLPDKLYASENGLKFVLAFGGKQNFGFFLDMAPGREWLMQRAKGKRILNLFSYTCSFSVAAIAGGASSVINLDMSKAALTVGRDNHRANQQGSAMIQDVQFLAYDLFRSWNKIIRKGPYDIVIIDPPTRQKGSFMAEKDYARVIRRLPQLLTEGGEILACLNAPTLGEDFLADLFAQECAEAQYVRRLDNRDDFPESDTQRNLKMLVYRL